ncbi:hypothetical protein J4772_33520 [Cohnella sp. LGH]|uniref:hypothetical protein n=1 Tax=Cohnella sp. LGH TaxID=1619153 RepID=UPI001ADD556A|nr:hypothetical protein [Cohnella sp. LGH]QTH42341.1 hypothetical protein J4772_33520 [Cohnella sp. LGH]
MKAKINALLLMLALLMLVSNVQPTVHAESTKENSVKVLEPTTLGNVKLKANVNAKISNLFVLPANTNQIVSLTLTITNNSNSELNFLDYWVKVTTKNGSKLNLQMVDSNIKSVAARSSRNIDFVGTAGASIKASDLVIQIIQWDFSASNYTKVLGKISVPSNYNMSTPSTQARRVINEDMKAVFQVKQTTTGVSEKYYIPQINLSIKNEGNRSITLPDYQFYVMTSNQLMYPLNASDVKGTELDPLMDKEFLLTTTIPISVEQRNWKLVIVNPKNEGKDKQGIAMFNLVSSQIDTGEVKGKYYTITTAKGIYNVKLNSLNRLPIEDEDLIIANLTIANTTKASLPYPNLSAKYLFNSSIEKSASVTSNNKVISIPAGASSNIQIVTKVPYTFDIDKLNVVLQQKETTQGTNEQTTDLVKFALKANFDPIPMVTATGGFQIEDIGYRSAVSVKEQNVFEGSSANLLVAKLEVKNLEKRQASMKSLAGYFEKPDGNVYPAKFANVSQKLTTGGSAIVYVTSLIPKGVDVKDIKLVVGKALTEQKAEGGQNTDPTEQLIGYIDPHVMALPTAKEVQDNMQKLALAPFEFSITRIGTQTRFDKNEITMGFDYTLSRDLLTKANTKDHKIVIEIKDETHNYSFSRELSLPNEDGTTNGEENTALKFGNNTLNLAPWYDEQFVSLIRVLKDFRLNVYYQVEPGYKTLIATQTIPWYVDRKLN